MRSEVASVASTMAVRPGPSGVAWVSTTEPAPSPATIVIAIVRGSGAWKRASTSTATGPATR